MVFLSVFRVTFKKETHIHVSASNGEKLLLFFISKQINFFGFFSILGNSFLSAVNFFLFFYFFTFFLIFFISGQLATHQGKGLTGRHNEGNVLQGLLPESEKYCKYLFSVGLNINFIYPHSPDGKCTSSLDSLAE